MSAKHDQVSNPTEAEADAQVPGTDSRRPWVKPQLSELAVSRTYSGVPGPGDGPNPYT